MDLSVFKMDVSSGSFGWAREGSYVRVRMRELMMAGMGKKTRKRSVRTFKLPSTIRGTKDSRHCAADYQQCSGRLYHMREGELTPWIWLNLPCALKKVISRRLLD